MDLLCRKIKKCSLNKNLATGSAILEIKKKNVLEIFHNARKNESPGEGRGQVYYGDTD